MMSQESFHTPKEISTERSYDELSDNLDRERISIDDVEYETTTTSHRKDPRIKANCLPVALLLFLFIVLNIEVRPSAGVKCLDPYDIQLKNRKTGNIKRCVVCPECPESQQYSIPCGSTVDLGTVGNCVDCPEGTFSSNFDKKPCQVCTTCTNKVYKQNCTKYQNAECGDCLPGYRYDPITFACNLIKKRTVLSTNTKAFSTKSLSEALSEATTTAKISPPSIPQIPEIFTSEYSPEYSDLHPTQSKKQTSLILEVEKDLQPSSTLKSDSKRSGSSTNALMIALVAIVSVILIVGVASVAGYYISKKNTANSSRRTDIEATTFTRQLLETTNNGKSILLSQYMNDSEAISHEKYGTICNQINAKAMKNFKALVCGLGIKPDTLYEFYSQTQGKGDFGKVLEALVSSEPQMTLENIAHECERQSFKDTANLFREEDKRIQTKEGRKETQKKSF